MLQSTKLLTLTVATLMLATVGGSAAENRTHGRSHRRQLVVTEATPSCVTDAGQDTLRIRGVNMGSEAPYVTLALVPLTALSGPVPVAGGLTSLQEIVVALPDEFCDNPASDLLAVMRGRVRGFPRTKLDLAAFELAIVGAADLPAGLVDQVNQNTSDIDANATAITDTSVTVADNTAAIGVNAAAVAGNGTAIGGNAAAIGANALLIGGHTTALGDHDTEIATNTANIVANTDAIALLGGGGGLSSEVHWYPTVHCNALVPDLNQGWDTDNTLQATVSCANPGTDVLNGDLTYPNSSGRRDARLHLVLPADQTDAIDIRIFWSAGATVGDVEWLISTACIGDDSPVTPVFNAEQAVVDSPGARPIT